MPSFCMRLLRVLGLMPRRSAAPPVPANCQPVRSSIIMMCCRSASASNVTLLDWAALVAGAGPWSSASCIAVPRLVMVARSMTLSSSLTLPTHSRDDGISHVLMSPDDLVPVVAIALLAGLNGATAARRTLFAATAAWVLAGIAGFVSGRHVLSAAAPALSFLALGSLIAADWKLP